MGLRRQERAVGDAIPPGGWPGLPFFLHFLAWLAGAAALAGAEKCNGDKGLRATAGERGGARG
jgi:hypothetical protein